MDDRLVSARFPRASAYHPDWILAAASGGAHSLWMTEWLTESLDIRPGMRVLDLGCGRAASSIFLHREFGAQVWATDLWFNPTENFRRIQDAGFADAVFPIHADARELPFADEYFDAIVSIDSFVYYGTDDHYLNSIVRYLRPGGQIGIAGAGLIREIEGPIPGHLREWWSPQLWSMHSSAWWQRHWEKTGLVQIELADTLPDGWRFWQDWHQVIAPDNALEIRTLAADRGDHLGYVRVVGRRTNTHVEEPITSIPAQYTKKPLLRSPE